LPSNWRYYVENLEVSKQVKQKNQCVKMKQITNNVERKSRENRHKLVNCEVCNKIFRCDKLKMHMRSRGCKWFFMIAWKCTWETEGAKNSLCDLICEVF
jgi:hypothetical protein